MKNTTTDVSKLVSLASEAIRLTKENKGSIFDNGTFGPTEFRTFYDEVVTPLQSALNVLANESTNDAVSSALMLNTQECLTDFSEYSDLKHQYEHDLYFDDVNGHINAKGLGVIFVDAFTSDIIAIIDDMIEQSV